ncbi:SAV_915 family protein [Streptomyces sp. B1866]|uniref:SAV_915 family protein n=1 Tax=Streptomyces sp. B1866 TaxID=3075431 RepID=UPI00288F1A51|nr:SAV_915 family protein [Streptomyces sp. B1866]MDT3398050.1 SAV_915 family protein [Streptomyces sp. B1866]
MNRTEDGEPSDDRPAEPLYVPVRQGPAGCALRLYRTPMGARTAVAFTTRWRLAHVLGPDQAWIRLAEPAVRELTRPLGVDRLSVDPVLTAAPPRHPAPRMPAAPAVAETAPLAGLADGRPPVRDRDAGAVGAPR